MNCGLSNLDTLKGHLLAGTMAGETKFDAVISMIGLGVAGLFDNFCNRNLSYMVDDFTQFSGDRPHWYASRFPVYSVKIINMAYFNTDTWCEITGQPIVENNLTGLIHFGYTLGRFPLMVNMLWTGGYWFETLEPDDEGYPSAPPPDPEGNRAIPARFFLLPDVLRAAFLFQCEALWAARDKLGVGLIDKPAAQSGMAEIKQIGRAACRERV